ncbi:hypothetical protein ACEWY4_012454 [Coilia grayii]|uniref:Ig-like domain-containing protein n=1 Tax=Coilia grayii TaxID=363190 RepID=A0ABD1K0R3_9TELE
MGLNAQEKWASPRRGNGPQHAGDIPKVRWFKNGLEVHHGQSELSISITPEGSLLIGSLSASQSGDYKCVATNEAGSVERKTRLKVIVPPEIQDDGQPLNLTVTQKQPLTLGCDAFGLPSPTITWTKDGRPVVETPGVYLQNGNRLLRIYRVQAEHAGRFSCRAQNPAGETHRDYHIDVQGSGGVQDVSAVVNQQVELQCRVSGKPLPTVEWTHDGEVLSASGDPHVDLLQQGQVLRIRAAHVRDQGLYQSPPSIRGSGDPEEVSVVLGFPAVLSCEAEGSPPPTITWLKAGVALVSGPQHTYLRGGQELRLGAASTDDADTYTCRASNPAGSTHRQYTLRVLVPPQIESGESAVSVSVGRREEKVRINGTLLLSCQAKAFPEPSTQWFKDGQLVEGGSHPGLRAEGHLLHLNSATLEHQGQYTCVVTNTAGEDKRDFHITIQVPPIFQRVSSGVAGWGLGEDDDDEEGAVERREVVLGHPVSLTCESNAIPPPQLHWYRHGHQISSSPSVLLLPGGQVLQIPRVQLEDAGKYTCEATNEAGQDRMHFELEVLVAPAISSQSEEFVEEVSAVVNSSVVLQCDATGNPPPALSWLRDGRPLFGGPDHHILEDGAALELLSVQVSDMAGYLCVAENKVGAVEKLFSLSVQVPPKMIGHKEEEVSVVEGHMASLLCDVQAYPPPDITWTRDGQLLQFSTGIHILPGGQMLQLPRVRKEDAGQYVCTATNSAGQDQKSILLNVYVLPSLAPRPEHESEVMTPAMGSTVSLRCEARGTPEPDVTWYRNGLQLAPGNGLKIERHHLDIQEIQVADGGLYTCKVSNVAGHVDRTFRVTVHVPPVVEGPPEESVTQTLGTHATLLCEATGVPVPSITWLKDGSPIGQYRQSGWGSGIAIDNDSISN